MHEANEHIAADQSVSESKPINRVLGRDWLGSLIGLGVFLGGIGLLVMVFLMAKAMFTTPPRVPLNIVPGKPIDLNSASEGLTSIVVKYLLLLLMGATASLICNRGINLYTKSQIVR
jgi:hypothetical protein